MGNLFSAGLYRLLRNKLFYVGLGIMALLQVYVLENKKDAVCDIQTTSSLRLLINNYGASVVGYYFYIHI